MRLSEFERQTLIQAAQDSFGQQVQLRLYGSRVDDARRGGDIDLLVEVPMSDPAQIARAHSLFLTRVYGQLGEQKIDLLIDFPGRQTHAPIFEVARREGVAL
jgi:predicted nucleotidyltransferase